MARGLAYAGAAIVAVFGLALLASEIVQSTDCWTGYGLIAQLNNLRAAQEEFRNTDADRNGLKDYWRKDVAGLYSLAPAGKPLRFINLSDALSDHDPVVPIPEEGESRGSYGWWLNCLKFSDEKTPDPQRYAFCAWPQRPELISWVFVISHAGIIYGKESSSPQRPSYFPTDPIGEGWLTVEQIRDRRWKERHPLGRWQFWRD